MQRDFGRPGTHRNANRVRAAAIFGALLMLAPTPVFADCNSRPSDGVDWSGCRKRNLMLDGSSLKGANLGDADFTSTDLRGTQLEGADFSKATLVRSMVDNSKATGANFEKAVGFRTSFVKAELAGAKFAKSEMQRADFSGANLTGADFEKSELGRAIFTGAWIDGAVFRFANLARADLRSARFSGPLELRGAFLFRTMIEGVDLSNAVGLAQWQIDMACGNDSTKLPSDLTAPSGWPCAAE